VLVDLSPLGCCTNHALEGLYKAASGADGLDDGIWLKHKNPFLTELVEKFTAKGLVAIKDVADELGHWLARDRIEAGHQPQPFTPNWGVKWSANELAVVRLYLESLPRAAFSLDDWDLVVEYLLQRYLPVDAIQSEAEWLAVKSTLMGKVQANVLSITAAGAWKIAKALPDTVKRAELDEPALKAAAEYAKARACDNVVALSDSLRHRMKATVINFVAKKKRGDTTVNAGTLQANLQDVFAAANRDWRRIAITEAGEAFNQGFVASLPVGTKVRRIEAYEGACQFCKSIDGRVATVVSPDKPDKNWDTEIWAGKDNVGRSASPRKRVADGLVNRSPEEMWTLPAGLAHPHCRGQWHAIQADTSGAAPDFKAWLDARIKKG
jgi:hypothetical protein